MSLLPIRDWPEEIGAQNEAIVHRDRHVPVDPYAIPCCRPTPHPADGGLRIAAHSVDFFFTDGRMPQSGKQFQGRYDGSKIFLASSGGGGGCSQLLRDACQRQRNAEEKPSFKRLIGKRGCLVVADGFYEWARQERRKAPMRFVLKVLEMIRVVCERSRHESGSSL